MPRARRANRRRGQDGRRRRDYWLRQGVASNIKTRAGHQRSTIRVSTQGLLQKQAAIGGNSARNEFKLTASRWHRQSGRKLTLTAVMNRLRSTSAGPARRPFGAEEGSMRNQIRSWRDGHRFRPGKVRAKGPRRVIVRHADGLSKRKRRDRRASWNATRGRSNYMYGTNPRSTRKLANRRGAGRKKTDQAPCAPSSSEHNRSTPTDQRAGPQPGEGAVAFKFDRQAVTDQQASQLSELIKIPPNTHQRK